MTGPAGPSGGGAPADTVSVVMPVKNGARFLEEGLAGIQAQTRPPDEILVVDGDSTDGSLEIASSYEQVTVLRQPGVGIANAWNHGIERSTGSLIAFQDSDDRWLPGKLEKQVELLQGRPELAGAIGRVRHFLEPGYDHPPGLRPELLENEYVAQMPSVMLVRRETFERVGPFDESYEIASDIDWFARFKDLGLEWGAIDELLAEKRCHDSNLSIVERKKNNAEMARLLRDSVARQRGAR